MQKIIKIFIVVFLYPLLVLSQQQPTKDELQKQKKQLEQEIKELNDLQESISKNKKLRLNSWQLFRQKLKKENN